MTSVRQSQTTKGSKLQRVSLAITNKCNFKCRMCNPVDSSAWGSDISATKILFGDRYNRKKHKFIKHKDDYASIDWIIDQCKKEKLLVNLLGGEPFISPGFLYFLEQVNKYNLYDNISLVITTNLSVTKYKRIDFIQELSKFKDLDIYASIDGCFKVGEYIRQGFDFKKFRSNHFVCYQVDYKRVKFLNGSYLYSIYSNYDGANIGEASLDAGIIISNSSEAPEIQISCAHI